METNNILTSSLLNELSDSDLLIIASSKGKVKLDGLKICFSGEYYFILPSHPITISSTLRNSIIDELVKTQLD